MTQKKRILEVLAIKPVGGVGTFLKNSLDFTEEIAFDFAMSAKDDSGIFNDFMKSMGAEIFLFPNLGAKDYLSYWKSCKEFYKANAHKYQAIHVHTPVVSLPHFYFAKKYGVPVRIYHSHNMKYSGTKIGTIRNKAILEAGLKYATDFFACGNLAGKNILKNRPFTIIKNGIDTQEFLFSKEKKKDMMKQLGLENKIIVGMVGSLIPSKNHIFMLKVAKILKDNPNFVFLFLGDGSERKTLETFIEEHELNNVKLMGRVENVQDYYHAIDVLVLPSFYEGFPLVAVEAQTCGIPILLSDQLDTSVILNKQSQLLSIEGEKGEEIWSKTITELVFDEDKRLFGAQEIKELGYDIDDTRRDLSKAYHKLLTKG